MPYSIGITNGSGSADIANGSYTAAGVVTGYTGTFSPSTVNIISGADTYAFTIAAEGNLTLHVTENGDPGGTAVEGATFVRCDSAGTQYGSAITTGADGNAVFQYVPYAGTGAPLIYYRQTGTAIAHTFSPSLANTSLATATGTVEIQNALSPVASRTINLTDTNYLGLPIETGTINLTEV